MKLRLVKLRLADLQLVARAWSDLILIDRRLSHEGLDPLLVRIELEAAAPREVSREHLRLARRYARRIALAAHICPVGARCLHRSLVLHMWLRRQGLPSRLRFGVWKAEGDLRAHAWVELAGVPVNDDRRALQGISPMTSPRRVDREAAYDL